MGGNQSKGGGNSGNSTTDGSKYKGVDYSKYTSPTGQKLDLIVGHPSGYTYPVVKSSYPSGDGHHSSGSGISDSVSFYNVSSGSIGSYKSPYYLDLAGHFSSLKSKFSTFDVGYGKIHTDSVIGGNPYYSGTYLDEIIYGVHMGVSTGTLHHKLAINLYHRGVSDNDVYNLGDKLSGVTLNLCLFDLQKNNITTLGMNAFIHFFKYKNINNIDFSSNKLGDAGCNEVGAALAAGWLPNLHTINLSDNQITNTGYGYIVKALNAVAQDLKIVFETVKGFSKDTLKATMKSMVFIAKNNGINTKEMLTTDETMEHCKKGSFNVAKNIAGGIVKCVKTPVKYLAPKDVTLQDVAIDVLCTSSKDPKVKAVCTFICISQATVFSVIDEDFTNCLVGMDSMLND